MRMNKYVYYFVSFSFLIKLSIYLSILPLDFYMPAVLKYKGIAVVASLIYWMGQLL